MYLTSDLTNRRSKILSAILPAAALLALATGAHAIAPLGDDAEIFVVGTANVQHSSNVFLLSNQAQEETVFNLSPGVEIDFGKNAQFKGDLSLIETWEIFDRHDDLNANMANLTFSSNYDDGKTSFRLNAGFVQANQPTATIRGGGLLVNRNTTSVGLSGEELVSDKSSLGAGLNFTYVEYKTPGYSDLQSTTVPVDYYYKYDPKLDLSVGGMFRANHIGNGGVDSRDYFVDVGARGEFTPLLTGQVRVGFEEEHSGTKLGNNTTVGIQSNFSYVYSPKTNITFGINNDYGYNSYGAGFRDFGVRLGAVTTPMDQWSFSGAVGFDEYAYTDTLQKDDYYSVTFGATYTVTQNASVTGGVTWSDDNSNAVNGSFQDTVFTLSVALRY